MVKHLTESDFDSEVLESEQTVLVDFYADWCGPCKMLSPVIEEIAAEQTNVKICKVNVDDESGLAQRYGVMSIPTMIVVKNGKVVERVTGALPKAKIVSMLV